MCYEYVRKGLRKGKRENKLRSQNKNECRAGVLVLGVKSRGEKRRTSSAVRLGPAKWPVPPRAGAAAQRIRAGWV